MQKQAGPHGFDDFNGRYALNKLKAGTDSLSELQTGNFFYYI